jgi:LacI family transcriptional regulator
MAVTILDVARIAGTSTATVSQAMNSPSRVATKTRRRVLAAVKKLKYHPSRAARALVTGKTYAVGLVVPGFVHPFFAEVAQGLSKVLRRENYCLLTSSSEEDPRLERQEIERLLGWGVDVIIVASTQHTVESFRLIEENNIPYVLIDRCFLGLPANFVGVDDVAVGYLATQHLVSVGCRRVAHIGGPDTSVGIRRLEGYNQALAANDLQPFSGYIVRARTGDVQTYRTAAESMSKLLRLNPPPDGVFCFNDPLAIGAIDTIQRAGLRVPGDIAVIGCGNLPYDRSLCVPLSSIDQQTAAIGERAAKLALLLTRDRTPPRPKSIIIKARVIQRASTQRKPGC